MARNTWIAVVLATLLTGSGSAQQSSKDLDDTPKSIAAPIVYEELLLILADANGVAIVVFEKQFDDRNRQGKIESRDAGTHYRFRYLPKGDNQEIAGSGVIREKLRREPTENPNKFNLLDEGSVTEIKAGSILLKWSLSSKERGYVYYLPEELRVQIGHARDFATVDLKRFQR